MSVTDALDLVAGQRSGSFRFDLLDHAGAVIGELNPVNSKPATLGNRPEQTIPRTLTGVAFDPVSAAAVNPLRDRLRLRMVLPGLDPYALPWGVFMFGHFDRYLESGRIGGRLLDLRHVLDDQADRTVQTVFGGDCADAIEAQLDAVGIVARSVDCGGQTFGRPAPIWPAGTSRLTVVDDIAALAGCHRPYFDNAGTFRVRPAVDLAAVPAGEVLVYEAGGRILTDSLVETTNLLDAKNRFVVAVSGPLGARIRGEYEVPADAPHSFDARGIHRTEVELRQGTRDQAGVEARARAMADEHGLFAWVTFDSPPDPRHDTHDTVELLGVRYRETEWSVQLVEGARMTHSMFRTWAA